MLHMIKPKRKSINKKGGVIFLIDMLVISLFPIIMVYIIDSSNIYFINKHLKSCLDLAVKSASIYENQYMNPGIPNGLFYIDDSRAMYNFKAIFDLNYNSSIPIQSNASSQSSSPSIVSIQKQAFIYNDFSSTTFPSYNMSTTLLGKYPQFKINVTRPTVLGVARVRYRNFYGKEVDILKYSSSQMSNKSN